jgi:hypothetical protein
MVGMGQTGAGKTFVYSKLEYIRRGIILKWMEIYRPEWFRIWTSGGLLCT